MGGYGSCPLCKETKLMTTHHDKTIKRRMMMCRECHNIVEAYVLYQKKISDLPPDDEPGA